MWVCKGAGDKHEIWQAYANYIYKWVSYKLQVSNLETSVGIYYEDRDRIIPKVQMQSWG